MGRKARIPAESLLGLRRRLASLPARAPERRQEIARVAELFGVSAATVYRALQDLQRPKDMRRADRGHPRALDEKDMTRYCEVIAARKIRTGNGQGRKLSTNRAIEIFEEHGVDTPDGHVRAAPGTLRPTTVNRWLRTWGLDHPRMIRGPAAVRFEARHANECWQFDMSSSDLKHIDQPDWIEPGRGNPTLMLFSVVDDRSGVAYQEYRCVYGEDAESALRFLFNAMAPKADNPLQGIPGMLYLERGRSGNDPGDRFPDERPGCPQPGVPDHNGAARHRLAHAYARRFRRQQGDGAGKGEGRTAVPDG